MSKSKSITIKAGAALLFGLAATLPLPARAADPADLVEALHVLFGQNHARAAHAKGVVLSGSFTPAASAATLTKAALFRGGAVPVTARFSNSTGLPKIPDTDGYADPRGFAVKFGTDELDIVTHSFNGFPAANPDEFGEFLRAIAASTKETTHPNSLEKFLASHPAAKTFATTQKPPPVSYATTPYFGVNAFAVTNDKGEKAHVRYRLVPAAGEHYLDAAAAKSKGPDYLSSEIRERLGAGPVQFDWFAQVAGAGDKTDDPTAVWPDNRQLVKLGTITINRIADDQGSVDKSLLFLPGNVPDGIEAADPMIDVRNAAYAVSFGERQ